MDIHGLSKLFGKVSFMFGFVNTRQLQVSKVYPKSDSQEEPPNDVFSHLFH